MTVFVAGGAGFLGSHVCEYYRNSGEDVVCYDNFTYRELARTPYGASRPRAYMTRFLYDMGVKVVKGDILNPEFLNNEIADCDYIVNCAAQPAMTVSIEDPILDHHVNVGGTINLLEAARKYDIPILHCSTIHVYGNKNKFVTSKVPVNENMPVLEGDVTPLHASKLSSEHYCRAYTDTYGVKAGVFRLTGMYGPRQFGGVDHGWVANFCIRHLTRKPIVVFGTVEQYRDILYVSDAVRAIDSFRNKPYPGMYNIGGGFTVSFRDVFEHLEHYSGRIVQYEVLPERQGDMHWFCCDAKLAKRYFNWEPTVSFREGITNLCNWVKQNEKLVT